MDTKPKKSIFVCTLYITIVLAVLLSVTGNVRAENAGLQIGLIVNVGGVDDNSFNSMAYQGLLLATDDIGITPSVYEPVDENEFDVKLEECAEDQNELCIAVGFNFGISLANVAREHPETLWAIVDYTYPDCWEGAEEGIDCGSFTELPNVRGLSFDEKLAGYLAGVLAGGMTTSNVVGAVGGMEIPPVVAFIEGYRNGAQCTNHAVNVLTAYTDTFSDPDLGATTAEDMIGQGADVIFGPAGQTGDGAILYSAQNGTWAIGVDDDRYLTVFDSGAVSGADKLLSSAMKRVDNAVYQTIADYVVGNFSSGTILYDLATDGVGLAPFHETDESIPQSVKDNLDAVVLGIMDGTVDINSPCNPFIAVSITEHWFWVNNFTPETLVTFSIYDNPGDENPILEFSTPTDEMGNRTIEGWQHIWDPEAGDYIVATDGYITKDLVLDYITLEESDPGDDLVWGYAMPGHEVGVGVGNESGEQWMNVFADEVTGEWIAQFEFNNGEDYLTEDSWAGGHVNDEDGDVTAAHNSGPPESPAWFTVFPEWNAIEAWNFPLGADVHLAIYEDPDAPPVYEQSEPVIFTPWDSWELWVWFDLAGAYEIKAGDIVTLSYGEIERTHIVQNLTVTKANHDDDTIKGIADPGAEVYVWPHATGEQLMAIAKTEGKSIGKWTVDFSGIYDIAPGECGRSEIRDEFANSTAVDWCIPNPRIVASESGDWFWTTEFKPGDLDIYIYESADVDANLLWSNQQVADESGFAFVGSDIHGLDLVQGNYLVISDDDSQKSLALEPISVTMFDTQYEFMAGFAPPGSEVWAAAGPMEWQERIMVGADQITGAWFANFADIGFDITEDMQPWSYAHIYDEDGDANEGSVPSLELWVVAYTYDRPAGYWSEGPHTYHFEAEWNGGSEVTDEVVFNVSSMEPLYDGYALLRPGAVKTGPDCPDVDSIHPDQLTRFLVGYLTDYPMTYAGAQAYFDNLTARAVWDNDMSAGFTPHEIMPFSFNDLDAWFNYVCTFTE